MTLLVFKQVPRGSDGDRFLYTLDFLDMKFTIAEHKTLNELKIFAGFKQDDGSIVHLEDFKARRWYELTELRKKEPSSKDKVDLQIKHIANYIKQLYGFKEVETTIHEHMNMLIEQWLSET
jgi:hypothetical protein